MVRDDAQKVQYVEAVAGSSVKTIAEDLCLCAKDTSIIFVTNINGVLLAAHNRTEPEVLMKQYNITILDMKCNKLFSFIRQKLQEEQAEFVLLERQLTKIEDTLR